jgi:phosphatidylglycerophosphate synthase
MGLGGGGSAPWYIYLFLSLAIFIVCPVWCLEEIGRFEVDWRHVIWLEVIAASIMVAATILLMPMYPKLHWWHPLSVILFVVVARAFIWSIYQMFKGEIGDD